MMFSQNPVFFGILASMLCLGAICRSSADVNASHFPAYNETVLDWIKYANNPVISEQSSTYFNWPGDPYVLQEDDSFAMYFGANVIDNVTFVGYATSLDGLNWNIHPNAVLGLGTSSEWDCYSVETPCVLKLNSGTYMMWYTGAGLPANESNPSTWEAAAHKIGLAYSDDGVNWTKYAGNPVLDVTWGQTELWDFAGKADPMVLKNGSVYHLYYTGAGIVNEKMVLKIGHATSTNGINWVKDPNNPVLSTGKTGTWNNGSVSTPSVVYDQSTGRYLMGYTGIPTPEIGVESGLVGLAYSSNGIDWIKDLDPFLNKGSGAEYDNYGIWGPSLFFNETKSALEVYYSALQLDSGLHVSVGYANTTLPSNNPLSSSYSSSSSSFANFSFSSSSSSSSSALLGTASTYSRNLVGIVALSICVISLIV